MRQANEPLRIQPPPPPPISKPSHIASSGPLENEHLIRRHRRVTTRLPRARRKIGGRRRFFRVCWIGQRVKVGESGARVPAHLAGGDLLRHALLTKLVTLAAALQAVAAERPASQWVYPDAGGKLAYQTTPDGDHIMDFSQAGYMGGGVALPVVPVIETVKPTGSGGDAAAIQAAVDAVSALPLVDGFRGAVLLSPGAFVCPQTITISASGVVLRGGGAKGEGRTTLKLVGQPHTAIVVRAPGDRDGGRGRRDRGSRAEPTRLEGQEIAAAETTIADAYVPSGTSSFDVHNARGLAVGDLIAIRKPVTRAWIEYMRMHDLMRDGRRQTWLPVGRILTTERQIAAIAGNTITLDVPLSDSIDAKYLDDEGTAVVKVWPSERLSQVGVEHLHIESPPQPFNHSQRHFTALRLNGQDCWVRDVAIDETMNSVGVGGRRITLQRVSVTRKALHEGSSKPAEFAPNASQVLLDRCAVTADNVWFVATGGGQAGPIVLLNCKFQGESRAESHQRWSTGMLYDNCQALQGGIDFRNRGSMGSGHGWSMGWGVAWNCEARDYIIQHPPGAPNWMIGCIGRSRTEPRPFGEAPLLPEGIKDSHGMHVAPSSLYLAQLAERLGPAALQNIGYDDPKIVDP
jgi:hypothetical protein